MPRVVVADSFTDTAFAGNPAAVLVLEHGMPEPWMQSVAAEMKHSETAFCYRERDAWRIRWYSPTREVELCGHATLAAAHVLWEDRHEGWDAIRFRSLSGELIARQVDDGLIELDFPLEAPEPFDAPDWLPSALGAKPVSVHANRLDIMVELESDAAVRALKPDLPALAKLDPYCVAVTARGRDTDYVLRYFAPSWGIPEDDATGSAQCGLAPLWSTKLAKAGRAGASLTVEQASRRGARMRVRVDEAAQRVRIAGRAVTTMRGDVVA